MMMRSSPRDSEKTLEVGKLQIVFERTMKREDVMEIPNNGKHVRKTSDWESREI
jgi:hypothetical protein